MVMNWTKSGPHPSGITIWKLDDPTPYEDVTIHSFNGGDHTVTFDRHQAPHISTLERAQQLAEMTIAHVRNPPKKRRSKKDENPADV